MARDKRSMANKQQMTSNDASIRRHGRGSHYYYVGVHVYGSEVGKLCRHVTTAVWRGSVAKSQFLWWTVYCRERALTALFSILITESLPGGEHG